MFLAFGWFIVCLVLDFLNLESSKASWAIPGTMGKGLFPLSGIRVETQTKQMHCPQKCEIRLVLHAQSWLFLSKVLQNHRRLKLQTDTAAWLPYFTIAAKSSQVSFFINLSSSLSMCHLSVAQEEGGLPNKFPFLVTCVSLEREIHNLQASSSILHPIKRLLWYPRDKASLKQETGFT